MCNQYCLSSAMVMQVNALKQTTQKLCKKNNNNNDATYVNYALNNQNRIACTSTA